MNKEPSVFKVNPVSTLGIANGGKADVLIKIALYFPLCSVKKVIALIVRGNTAVKSGEGFPGLIFIGT